MFSQKSEVKRETKLANLNCNVDQEILKREIREYLNFIIANNIVVSKIIWHIDIQISGIFLSYTLQLAQLLQDICSTHQEKFSQKYGQFLEEERLILRVLKIINDSITQFGFQSLDCTTKDLAEIKRQFNLIQIIEEPSKNQIKIIQQIRLIRFEAQHHKTNFQQIKIQEYPQIEQIPNKVIPPPTTKITTEQINDNILKILLLKLNEFSIIMPNLLRSLQFTTEGRRYDFYQHKELLVLRSTNEVMLEILANPKMKAILQEQNLISFPRIQILQQLVTDVPESNSFTLLSAQEKTIEMMVEKCDQNLEGFLSVFVDERFRALLQQVQSLCGTKIKLILDRKVNEDVENSKYEGNVLKIGTMLMRMQQILQSFQPNSSQMARIKQNKYYFETTSEKKQMYGEIYSTTNPVYKKFITKLVNKQQAFPYFLKTIHVRKFVVQISYRKSLIQELLTFPKFLHFLKKEFQLEFDEQETINQRIRRVQEIGRPEYEDEDGRQTWPKLILKQLNLIYEQREQITQELQEAVGSRKYQQLLKDLNNIQEMIPDRRAIKDIIFDINDYILTLS